MVLSSCLKAPMFKVILTALTPCLFFSVQGYGQTPAQFSALMARVTSLESTVTALQRQLIVTQATNAAQTAAVVTLQRRLELIASNPALQLGPFVTVDPNSEIGVAGPNITFKGANIHIVSGSGTTNDNGNPTGLGNLVIGYNETSTNPIDVLQPGDRGGSHNLIIGRYNKFNKAAVAGFVSGESNALAGLENVILGGADGICSGQYSVIVGGTSNRATNVVDVVVGGYANTTNGPYSLLLGGVNAVDSGAEFFAAFGADNIVQ